MKKWLAVLLIATVGAGALFAGSPRQSKMREQHPDWWMEQELLEQQLEAVLAENESSVLGDFTVGEAQQLLGEISIAYQKAAYVSKSRGASFILPGMGQFMNDDPGAGALFLSLDVLTGVGTLLGAYFLLPLGCALVGASLFRACPHLQALAAVLSLAVGMVGAAATARAWGRRRTRETPDG